MDRGYNSFGLLCLEPFLVSLISHMALYDLYGFHFIDESGFDAAR